MKSNINKENSIKSHAPYLSSLFFSPFFSFASSSSSFAVHVLSFAALFAILLASLLLLIHFVSDLHTLLIHSSCNFFHFPHFLRINSFMSRISKYWKVCSDKKEISLLVAIEWLACCCFTQIHATLISFTCYRGNESTGVQLRSPMLQS